MTRLQALLADPMRQRGACGRTPTFHHDVTQRDPVVSPRMAARHIAQIEQHEATQTLSVTKRLHRF